MDNNDLKKWQSNGVSFANYFSPTSNMNNWGPRKIIDYELISIVEGEAWYSESQADYTSLVRGDILLIPPDTTHTFHCKTEKESTISCIHFSFKDSEHKPAALVSKSGLSPLTAGLFRSVAREFIERGDDSAILMNLLLDAILVEFKRALTGGYMQQPAKIKQAISFMERHYAEEITRSKIAAYVAVTPEYLSSLFQKYCSKSLVEILTDVRLRKASEMLRKPGINVSQVAFMCGFRDPLYFSRVFKKQTGVAPREYSKGV